MLEQPIQDFNEWWSLYHDNDKCVLATSRENNSNSLGKIYPIDVEAGMFMSKGFAWSHDVQETEFLRELYEREMKA